MGRLVIDLPNDPHRYLSKMIKDKSDQKVGCHSLLQSFVGTVQIKLIILPAFTNGRSKMSPFNVCDPDITRNYEMSGTCK